MKFMSTCFVQYKYSEADLSSRTLWLSVWDWDRFGRNQFLGEVRLPLSSLDLTDTTNHWYSLQDKVYMYMSNGSSIHSGLGHV